MSIGAHLLHRHLLTLIVLSYVLAAAFPAWGLWIKDARIVPIAVGDAGTTVTLPALMLAFLLFSAGLRMQGKRVRQIARRPTVLLAGMVANLAVPLGYLLLIMPALGIWHNPEEAATVIAGLALVAAMPIAGSSTGWAQASDSDMALSLGLVLVTTLLSPLTTPAALRAVALLASGHQAGEFHHLAGWDAGAFLTFWVLLPSLLGMGARSALGGGRVAAFEHRLHVATSVTLLVLCYANASACLPQTLGAPDWDFLAAILFLVLSQCVLMFASGYGIARLLRVDRHQQAALMFGLGMNNNGTGMVLASVAFATRPVVLVPIIVYNLTQHLVAGCVHALLRR